MGILHGSIHHLGVWLSLFEGWESDNKILTHKEMSFGALLMLPFGDIREEMCCIVKESMNACNYLIIIMNFVINTECVCVCVGK